MECQPEICAVSWEQADLPAVWEGKPVSVHVRFSSGHACAVEVSVEGRLDLRGDGSDLFEALVSVRRALEKYGVMLVCNGSRPDVYPSPMLRQASNGRFAYVLTIPRSTARPPVVDIFAAAPEFAPLASVDEQRAWYDRWVQSGSGRQGLP